MNRRYFLEFMAASSALCGFSVAGHASVDSKSREGSSSGNSFLYNDTTDPWSLGLRPNQDHVLTAPFEMEPRVQETLNVWFYDGKRNIGFNIHPHHIQNGVIDGIMVTIFMPDGRVLRSSSDEFEPFTDPLRPRSKHINYHCIQPFREWVYNIDGLPVWETDRKELIGGAVADKAPTTRVSLTANAIMAAPIYRQGAMLPEADKAIDGEVGLWLAARLPSGRSPESFRFDQMFRAKGKLLVDGVSYEFDGCGLRGHVRGVRVMSKMYGHTWLGGLMPSGTAFGVQLYPRPGGGYYFSEAYIFKNGKMYPNRISYAPPMCFNPDQGEYVIELACDELGLTRIVGKDKRLFWWSMAEWGSGTRPQWGIDPNAATVMRQAVTEYTIDGEVGYGMNERSGPRNPEPC